MTRSLITLSVPTYVGPSGVTAAATYKFFTKDYQPPSQDRDIETDVVHNQNGKFKYVYDNGPGFKKWSPFTIICEDAFQRETGAIGATQFARLRRIWDQPGIFGLEAPEGVYTVHWAQQTLEQNFRVFPTEDTQNKEYTVVVQIEEGQ